MDVRDSFELIGGPLECLTDLHFLSALDVTLKGAIAPCILEMVFSFQFFCFFFLPRESFSLIFFTHNENTRKKSSEWAVMWLIESRKLNPRPATKERKRRGLMCVSREEASDRLRFLESR